LRLKQLRTQFEQLTYKVMELIVINKIVMEKLGITDEEIKEEFKRFANANQAIVEDSGLQSPDAGTDGDSQ